MKWVMRCILSLLLVEEKEMALGVVREMTLVYGWCYVFPSMRDCWGEWVFLVDKGEENGGEKESPCMKKKLLSST